MKVKSANPDVQFDMRVDAVARLGDGRILASGALIKGGPRPGYDARLRRPHRRTQIGRIIATRLFDKPVSFERAFESRVDVILDAGSAEVVGPGTRITQ